MDQDQEPLPYYSATEAPPPPQPRRVPRVAIAVGLTAFLGLGGAGLAFAAGGMGNAPAASLSSSSSGSSTTTLPGSPHFKFKGPAFRGGLGGIGGPGGPVVHAQYTVQDGSGYRTYSTQVGQVTAVSGRSITVKSADGFTQTYVVEASTIVDSQSGGISAVTGKDTVRIQALVSGSSQTATDIVDTTKIGASWKGFGLPTGPVGRPGVGPGGPAGDMAGPPIPA